MWQRYHEALERHFLLLGIAQDAQGLPRVIPIVEQYQIRFPVLIDRTSSMSLSFGFHITPAGAFVDTAGIVRYVHNSESEQFDVNDPRVRWNLERFLEGEAPQPIAASRAPTNMRALDLFAQGVELFGDGRSTEGLERWREALALDPDNFLIRSQIWAAEHPERFWPAVDRDWQAAQLLREGYDKPLP